jgi:large subunit ribosomal protein L9
MDVILLEDLKGVGAKGALVHVKPGYARNFLLPRKLAIPAGDKAGNLYREIERQKQYKEDRLVAQAREQAAKLEGVEVNIPTQANEEDTLFGSVTNGDVADALAHAGFPVDKHQVELPDHIKQLGRYEVPVRFFGGVIATVKVWVVRA